jgi:hypothetical protein
MQELIVLQPTHKEMILDFESQLLGENPSFEQKMKTWDARWRSEALDHYLPMGWSFGVLNEGRLSSYLLAQPFVFFRGLTQTLWVEWIGASNQDSASQVIEVAYRWARDKHFQKLVLEESQPFSSYAANSTFHFSQDQGLLSLSTSKMK